MESASPSVGGAQGAGALGRKPPTGSCRLGMPSPCTAKPDWVAGGTGVGANPLPFSAAAGTCSVACAGARPPPPLSAAARTRRSAARAGAL
eukprot:CAMPEP_0175523890 /NCGR_PEP_ID=MMETSP0096-20121207/18302_2 /TAXON_ID=311494 /ORGANISM="Alexandrium monilatum, Strain CCMP3105" /LENGTH=90 /DNA_ID=CAMNT_0016826441 /DNA_START=415 /DNA_END=683 /DNA_ORIENTATION=-